MSTERTARRRDLWLPCLIGLVGLLASLAIWGLLIADRRDQILSTARDTASETHEAVEVGLRHQIDVLLEIEELSRAVGLRPVDEWKASVGRRVDRVAGLDFVTWFDVGTGAPIAAAGRGGPAGETALDDPRPGPARDAPHLEGPALDATGRASYRVFVPVHSADERASMLVARFDVAPFLEAVLRARARGYALSVFWGDQEIFSRGSASSDPSQEWWRVEDTIALPGGATWRVVYRPTPAFASQRLTPIPHYLLAAGILLSIVLAALAYQLHVVVRQSRFLGASNRALEQRGIELESRVADRTEALQDAVKELEAFNYSVAHDLRSPLGAILNFATILEADYRDRPLDAEGVEILARMRRSASRATALLEDLLQLSRVGRAALTLERVDMTALAREIFAQVRVAEDDADIEFVVEPLPEAAGDRTLLGGVFANLFSNSLKYSRGCEKRRISVRGRLDDDECIYEVTDTGQGFDMRFVDKVFGLFERLHGEDDIEGTGVGLAMVSRIVRRHGGRVWAEGRPSEGARFSFALPVREVP